MGDCSVFLGCFSKAQDCFVGPNGREKNPLRECEACPLAIVKGFCRITFGNMSACCPKSCMSCLGGELRAVNAI